MAEYIGCRECESPYCKGCNLKNLETMLRNGKFDCIMNENRCINTAANVAPVVHAHWVFQFDAPYKRRRCYCSHCGKHNGIGGIHQNQEKPYCPNCGAKMDKYNEPEN